ncbi:MAG: hypothetical protein LBT19_01675, partial [Candidatus Nomurabacteria bacterium]|nr:hypothetical protein [Candidatus Nomurabacteria bacterium]
NTAGTTNAIAVTNNGTNVTNSTTYTHMKITYFDPSTSTVSIGGTTYDFYPNTFTSTNCSTMTASNAAISSTPAASIAYYRDTRNNQTYKIKKMVDGKCWMVDNLKYTNTTIANTADGTTGMTYNNTGGVYNTVDGTDTQSTANSDKAFYNNPMSVANCYSSTYAPANTLTNCGYLYNWYAATNGTGKYANAANTQATGSICPTNFRLPSATSDGTTATTTGIAVVAADFPVLNASMNAGALATGAITSYPTGWQPSGAWGGAFSGNWTTGLTNQGSYGYFWSSTADSATNARFAGFLSLTVRPGSVTGDKVFGFAVRCVLP